MEHKERGQSGRDQALTAKNSTFRSKIQPEMSEMLEFQSRKWSFKEKKNLIRRNN